MLGWPDLWSDLHGCTYLLRHWMKVLRDSRRAAYTKQDCPVRSHATITSMVLHHGNIWLDTGYRHFVPLSCPNNPPLLAQSQRARCSLMHWRARESPQ